MRTVPLQVAEGKIAPLVPRPLHRHTHEYSAGETICYHVKICEKVSLKGNFEFKSLILHLPIFEYRVINVFTNNLIYRALDVFQDHPCAHSLVWYQIKWMGQGHWIKNNLIIRILWILKVPSFPYWQNSLTSSIFKNVLLGLPHSNQDEIPRVFCFFLCFIT